MWWAVSDINDAIRWAAGLSIPGVPANPTPANVINLSFSGLGACSRPEQAAINDAVLAGAVVVTAAGNSVIIRIYTARQTVTILSL